MLTAGTGVCPLDGVAFTWAAAPPGVDYRQNPRRWQSWHDFAASLRGLVDRMRWAVFMAARLADDGTAGRRALALADDGAFFYCPDNIGCWSVAGVNIVRYCAAAHCLIARWLGGGYLNYTPRIGGKCDVKTFAGGASARRGDLREVWRSDVTGALWRIAAGKFIRWRILSPVTAKWVATCQRTSLLLRRRLCSQRYWRCWRDSARP